MNIDVRYFGQLKRAAGTASESVELGRGARLVALLEALAARHGDELRRQLFDDSGRPRPSLLVVSGDQQVASDSDRELADGESITLLPPIAGGARVPPDPGGARVPPSPRGPS